MAINTAKLLPPSKVSSSEQVKNAPRSASSVFVLRTQVIKVEKLLMTRNVFQKKLEDKKRIEREKDLRAQKEKKLETKQEKNEENASKKISAPKLGFLDVIKDFIFNVVLGYFAVRFVKHLPKLIGVFKLILQVGEFLTDFGGMLLNGLVSMIDWGYKAYDATRGFIKTVGGENGLQLFDKTMGVANKVINSMLIAGLLFSDLVESDAKQKRSPVSDVVDTAIDQGGKRVGQTVATNLARTGAVSAGAAAAIVSGVGLLASALGEGAFQLKKFTKKIENDTLNGLKNAKKDKNPITRFLKVGFYNAIAIPGMKFTNFLLNGIGVTLDIIGAPFRYAIELIRFALMLITNDQKGILEQRKNLGKFDARIRDGIREHFSAFLGPVFNLLGKKDWANWINKPGSFGSLYGNKAVKNMGYAEGGGLYSRTLEKVKVRELDPQPTTLKIGSDVGGDAFYPGTGTRKIEAFFPNPDYIKNMNTYKVFETSFSDLEDTPFLHPLMGVTMKGLMGNKPSSLDYENIGLGLNSFVNEIFSNVKVENDKTLLDEIGGLNMKKWARDSIFSLISGPLNEIISNLAKQLTLKRNQGPGGPSPSAQKGPEAKDNPLDGFGGEAEFVIGDSIAHGFAGRGGNGNETGDSMVGRSAVKVLEVLKARGDKLKGKLIDLSTGIANSATDWQSVEAQLSYLKSLNAKVRVLGVGNQWSSKNDNVNQKLEQIVKKYGFYFYGGFDASKDKSLGVHGDAATYKALKDKREGDVKAAASEVSPGGQVSGEDELILKLLANYEGLRLNAYQDAVGIWTIGFGATRIDGRPVRPGDKISKEKAYSMKRYDVNRHVGYAKSEVGESTWNKLSSRVRIPLTSIVFNYGSLGSNGANLVGKVKSGNIDNLARDIESRLGAHNGGINRWRRGDEANIMRTGKSKRVPSFSAFGGGEVPYTGMAMTHEGEFVVDKDSVESFGIEFLKIINSVENTSQLSGAAFQLVSILSQYTTDGYPETEDDSTYIVEEDDVYYPTPIPLDMGMNFGSKSSSGSDPSQDMLAM